MLSLYYDVGFSCVLGGAHTCVRLLRASTYT